MPALAQQATTARDVRQAYGSRLDRPDSPAVSRGAVRRLETRVNDRVNSRLSTRIERYTTMPADPTASLRTGSEDGARETRIIEAPLPPPDDQR